MKNLLVAAMAGTGALVGAGAAVAWHIAVPSTGDSGSTQVASVYDRSAPAYAAVGSARPDWFPTSLYFVGAGVLVALFVASFLVDAGLRLAVERHRSRTGMFALLIVLGGVLGAGAATAWTHWPPQPGPAADPWTNPSAYWERQSSDPTAQIVIIGGADTAVASRNEGIYQTLEGGVGIATESDEPLRPTIADPWLVFPLGGALIAAALALSLSLRDVRLIGRGSE